MCACLELTDGPATISLKCSCPGVRCLPAPRHVVAMPLSDKRLPTTSIEQRPTELRRTAGGVAQVFWIGELAATDLRRVLRGVSCPTCPAVFGTPCGNSGCRLSLPPRRY